MKFPEVQLGSVFNVMVVPVKEMLQLWVIEIIAIVRGK